MDEKLRYHHCPIRRKGGLLRVCHLTLASNTHVQSPAAQYKPSDIYDDGSKPWIWVRCEDDTYTADDMAKAIQQAEAIEIANEKRRSNLVFDAL